MNLKKLLGNCLIGLGVFVLFFVISLIVINPNFGVKSYRTESNNKINSLIESSPSSLTPIVTTKTIDRSNNLDHKNWHSKAILVYDLDQTKTVFELNAKQILPPASLVKIMTAIIALENLPDLEKTTTILKQDYDNLKKLNASMAGFLPGETITVKDLLCGLMLPSGADSALTLARLVAGNETNFVQLMNQKAIELNIRANFKNTTGLDVDQQLFSAQDIRKMLSYALENPIFRQIFTSRYYQTTANVIHPQGLNLQSTVLTKLDKKSAIIGGKSGTTHRAGLNWATLAKVKEREFLIITMGAPLDNLNNPTLLQKTDQNQIIQLLQLF